MSIRHNEIAIINSENPFENCKLGRKKYAEVLTSIIRSYPSGFVLAINNKWGSGKTTFVRMWEQDLKNKLYQTVYFNAWENDFENNPLVALMGELKILTTIETQPKFKTALKNAAIITKNLVPTIVHSIANKYIDTELICDTIENISKSAADIFENEVNEYDKKKNGIIEFKKSLAEFIEKANEGKPIVFIIDELDRCRPDYAVSILEQIKHFFSIPNIVFVLSIDKIQLGNAVRGVYGNDRIDSDEYLRRFIDIEYSIPEPDKETYYNYLYDYFDFSSFFDSQERNQYSELANDGNNFLQISKLLFGGAQISLRQQEKIFALSRLSLRSFQNNSYVIPNIFLLLIYIKIIDEVFYNEIKNKKIGIEELQEKFYIIIKNKISEDYENELMCLEAYFVLYYNNHLFTSYNHTKLYERDTILRKNRLLINTVVNPSKSEVFLDILESIVYQRNIGKLNLKHFLDKIDLTENILI